MGQSSSKSAPNDSDKEKEKETSRKVAKQARRDAEQARRDSEQARKDAERTRKDLEQARNDAEQARKDAERVQKGVEQAQKDVERAQKETQDAAQRDHVARLERMVKEAEQKVEESEHRVMEAQRREEEAQLGKEKAEEAARYWEEAAAEAERARKAADEALQVAQERLMRGIPPDLRPTDDQMKRSRERHGYGKHALNIALVGESGAGKSSLLNAVRGLWPDDPGAAPVGFNETTVDVQGYIDPRLPQVKWFDVPGANTPNISGWLYFMDQGLYIFDVLVILFSDRFTQTIGTLLSNAHQCGIRTFLVRTKSDYLIQSLKNDHRRRRLNDEQARRMFIDETQSMVYKNLNILKLPLQQVFMVSSSAMFDWVVEGDTTNVIDEKVVYQALLPDLIGRDALPALNADPHTRGKLTLTEA
ncbi:hypothetical protein GALMADRAFT_573774 [Galerina marginata CBS 339.88]|uniref:IRG-type G domain-containing protein n=1 Tax=Galerina marginata (strain CBS 339.88) TaxID=685588 RepID=A0A067STN6_GALM3|nr:hypothetical protein GALMADRAFT_573774 [Galerina marginata CBS 339.88]